MFQVPPVQRKLTIVQLMILMTDTHWVSIRNRDFYNGSYLLPTLIVIRKLHHTPNFCRHPTHAAAVLNLQTVCFRLRNKYIYFEIWGSHEQLSFPAVASEVFH